MTNQKCSSLHWSNAWWYLPDSWNDTQWLLHNKWIVVHPIQWQRLCNGNWWRVCLFHCLLDGSCK